MKLIGGIIVLTVAVWLYVVSTKMLDKDKENPGSGCGKSCAGCTNTACVSYGKEEKENAETK